MVSTENFEWFVLNPNELPESAKAFQEAFNAEVIGQEQAQAIALNAHERANNPLRDPTKPIAIYVLIGPSRTGKTRTAKISAKLTHGNDDALTIIEAGDYIERHQMLDLTGATPSYIGYVRPEEVAKLTPQEVDGTSKISAHNLRRVRHGSKSNIDIVCINEFEKGTQDFFRFWMGAWDNGFVVHGNGIKTDFRNTIFFVTMNLGMEEVEKLGRAGMGFNSKAKAVTENEIKEIVDAALQNRWPPEFRNRLTQVVIFRPLTEDEILAICALEVKDVQKRIETKLGRTAFKLEVTDAARQWLVTEAFKDNGNVAQLKRVVEKKVSDVLGRELHRGSLKGMHHVLVDVAENGASLVFRAGRALIPVPPPGASSKDTLSYRIQRAKIAMAHGDVPRKRMRIWLMTNDGTEAKDFEQNLDRALAQVFELPVVTEFSHKQSPFVVSKTVHTSLEMSLLIKELFAPHFAGIQMSENDG